MIIIIITTFIIIYYLYFELVRDIKIHVVRLMNL